MSDLPVVFTHSNGNDRRKGPNSKGRNRNALADAFAPKGVEEERPRLLPLALDSALGQVHHRCRLFDREPAKEAQLDDSRRTLTQRLELGQGLIEQDELVRAIGDR